MVFDYCTSPSTMLQDPRQRAVRTFAASQPSRTMAHPLRRREELPEASECLIVAVVNDDSLLLQGQYLACVHETPHISTIWQSRKMRRPHQDWETTDITGRAPPSCLQGEPVWGASYPLFFGGAVWSHSSKWPACPTDSPACVNRSVGHEVFEVKESLPLALLVVSWVWKHCQLLA